MTKRKTTDTTNTVNSTFSTSTSSSLTATPEAIELRLDSLPIDILAKIAEDTADCDSLRELSTVSKSLRSRLFAMNPWSQLIAAHFPEAPIPTDAKTAQYNYDGLVKTEYAYFTPFMISLFTAVKNNDLRQVYQLLNSLEFSIDKLPSYTDRQGRCLLSWVMLKNDPDMIDYFKCLLDRCLEESTDIDIELLISQAKILGHTELLIRSASVNIPAEPWKKIKRLIQCGQKVTETELGQASELETSTLLDYAAKSGDIGFFQHLYARISERQRQEYIKDPLDIVYMAANERRQEFLDANYTIFVSLIRQNNENIERDIHRLNYLCGRAALDIDFGYAGVLSNEDIRAMTRVEYDIFLNQQAIFLKDAMVMDDLGKIKAILERSNCLINQELGTNQFNTVYYALYYRLSYTSFSYLINTRNLDIDFETYLSCLQDSVPDHLIHHALLLVRHAITASNLDSQDGLGFFYNILKDKGEEGTISEKAFLYGLRLILDQHSVTLDDSDNDSVQDTIGANTP